MMFEIKTVETKEDIKELFYFFSKTFYKDALEHNEHYYEMSERFNEMNNQYELDKEFLMYIKDGESIIAGITGKDLITNDSKITMGILAVDEDYRNKGLAKRLIEEFENRCKKKNIKHIDLGARFRATPLYLKSNYKFYLMIQVFDFVTIDEIRNKNKYNFEETFSYQSDTYGFIFYKVDDIREEYIKYFESSIPTSHAQYIFEKVL